MEGNRVTPSLSAGVLFHDRSASREEVRRVVESMGVSCASLTLFDALAAGTKPRVAVLRIDEPPSLDDPTLRAAMALRKEGTSFVCYADGLERWSLAARCAPHYAGASALLERGSATFVRDLERALEPILAVERRREEDRAHARALMLELGIVASSAAMESVFAAARTAAPLSDLPVLVTGETGTGKQLVAEAVHKLDPRRRGGPFVAVNCGALPRELATSELFGHRRGAFTGAVDERRGLFRAAQGGALFLDEVGELEPQVQTALLRVLQERRVLGVGEDRETAVDVRVIAATNRDLEAMVAEGRFRADLFHRLNLLSVRIPPLRSRPEDYAPLVEHFLRKHGEVAPHVPRSASADFVAALRCFEMPGNTRELEHLVVRALLAKTDRLPLHLGDLPAHVLRRACEAAATCASAGASAGAASFATELQRILGDRGGGLNRGLAYCERVLVEAALARANGNQTEAARLLAITPRSIYNKLRKHGLHR